MSGYHGLSSTALEATIRGQVGFKRLEAAARHVAVGGVSSSAWSATSGAELLTNGSFATDSGWTKGDGWRIGFATGATAAGAYDMTEAAVATDSITYLTTLGISRIQAGAAVILLGSGSTTSRTTNGTFYELVTDTGGLDAVVQGSAAFDGDIHKADAQTYTLGSELVTNPGFITDSGWTKGANWTITGGGTSDGTQSGDSDLTQPSIVATTTLYLAEFDATVSAGNITIVLGDQEGTDVSSGATDILELITSSSGADVDMRADLNYVGAVDNVSVKTASIGSNLCTAGDFAVSTGWAEGAQWTITTGANSDGTQAGDADLTQTGIVATTTLYLTSFDVTRSAGNVTMVVGDQEGTDVAATATDILELITSSAATDVDLRADATFVGSVNNVSVKAATLGGDLVTNGTFDTDTGWTKGANWVIDAANSNLAAIDGTQGADSDLTEAVLALTPGATYQVTYTMSGFSAGTCTPVLGDTLGTAQGSNATFVELIVCGAGSDFDLRANSAGIFNVDTVLVKLVSLGSELVVNGDFLTDSSWTEGTGWEIGYATAGGGGASDLTYTLATTASDVYRVTYTVSGRTAGTITAKVGSTSGTAQTGNSTHVELIRDGGANDLVFSASATFDGVIDDVEIVLLTLGSELIVNGDFAATTGWTTLGTGWSLGIATAATSSAVLEQNLSLTEGTLYAVTFTIPLRTGGSVTPSLGGTAGTARSSAATYTEVIVAGSTAPIEFTGTAYIGTIDDVSVKEITTVASIISDPDFTIGTGWTLDAEWSQESGLAGSDASQSGSSDLTAVIGLDASDKYQVVFTVAASGFGGIAGAVEAVMGDGTAGTSRSTAATFTEVITAGANEDIDFDADATFNGTITGVSVLLAMDYIVGDYVTSGGATYGCIVAHAAGEIADEPGVGGSWTTNWELLDQHTDVKEFVALVAIGANLIFGDSCVASFESDGVTVRGDVPANADRILEGNTFYCSLTTVDITTGTAYAYYIPVR